MGAPITFRRTEDIARLPTGNRFRLAALLGNSGNIYRIGDQYLDEREAIEKYARLLLDCCRRCAHVRMDRTGMRRRSRAPRSRYVTAVPAEAPGEEA